MLAPHFYRLLTEPKDVTVDTSESNTINFSAGVAATKVKIVGAYFIRQAETVDILDDRSVMLVFRTDQSRIVRRLQYLSGVLGKNAGAAESASLRDVEPTHD